MTAHHPDSTALDTSETGSSLPRTPHKGEGELSSERKEHSASALGDERSFDERPTASKEEFTNPLGRAAGFTRSMDVFTRQWGFWIFLALVFNAIILIFIFMAVAQLDINNSKRVVEPAIPDSSASATP